MSTTRCLAALSFAALTPASTLAQGSARDLGTLGGDRVRAFDVSADGTVVVGRSDLADQTTTRAFRWTLATGMVDLGVLSGGTTSVAEAISHDGTVVVGSADDANGHERAVRWTNGGIEELGVLAGMNTSRALGVNGDGTVVVGRSSVDGANPRAFVWLEAVGIIDLGTLGGDTTAVARDINRGANVIVGESGNRAFRWTPGAGMQPLPVPVGSTATSVSGNGFVVAGSADGESYAWSFVGGVRGLGTFGCTGCGEESAFGIDETGSVIVGTSVAPDATRRAYRWTASTGLVDLGEAASGPGTGHARATSADGSVVVGHGVGPMGLGRAWIWTSSEIGERYCVADMNSTGRGALLNVAGSSLVSANELELSAEFLPQSSFGFFITSTARAQVPQPGGSQGTLCVGGQVGRFVGPGQILNSGSSGRFALTVDVGAIPTPTGFVAIQPGEEWNFQAWYRDVMSGPTSNFTDAVSVTFS